MSLVPFADTSGLKSKHNAHWQRRVRQLARHWTAGLALRIRGLQPVHFLHIYKTGGTALRHALSRAESSRGYALFTHKHSVGIDSIPTGHKIVFVVRDPIERFISGFYERQRQGLPRYHTPWSPAETMTFQNFDTPNAIGEALAGTPDQQALGKAAMAALYRINQPLTDWLGSPPWDAPRRYSVRRPPGAPRRRFRAIEGAAGLA